MKKLPILGIFTILSFTGFSQETAAPAADTKKGNTFELQAKGTVNSTWLFNKNISDIGDAQNYSAGWGYNYGLAFNAYFGNVGFGIEAYLDDHRGAYSRNISKYGFFRSIHINTL